jgi:hypothetical protein
VVGSTECVDCAEKNIKVEQAFKGLRVAIKCKSATGQYEIKGVSQLDKSGNFHVNLPIDLLHEESEGIATLKPACLAELRDQSNKACPKPDPLTLTLASKEKDQHTFTVGQDGKLQILSSICNSAIFWPPKWDPLHKKPFFSHPFFKKPYPVPEYTPPKWDPLHKLKPFISHPFFKKPYPVPEYTPTVPEYKPPTPVPEYKPPTPVPEYKPPTPPYQPPVPVYKPPQPGYQPPVPVYKPTPTPVPVYKPTPEPVYKPPLYKFPPLYHPHPKFGFPPIYKKPYGSHPWTKYFHKKPLFHKKPFFPPADTKN